MNGEATRLVCRTCLTEDAEFYNLDQEHLQYLTKCTNLMDVAEFPKYICTQCDEALKNAHIFVCGAVKAHKTLLQTVQIGNKHQIIMAKTEAAKVKATPETESPQTHLTNDTKGYRCNICGETVETKKHLKAHVKLHMDIINYSCEMCDFTCLKRCELQKHYRVHRGMQPTPEQLKLKIAMSITEDSTANSGTSSIYNNGSLVLKRPQRTHAIVKDWLANKMVDYVDDGEGTSPEADSSTNGDSSIFLSTGDDMDIDDIIALEPEGVITSHVEYEDIEDLVPVNKIDVYSLVNAKRRAEASKDATMLVKCSICEDQFDMPDMLKKHMLTHNELPHFFCDLCQFYTFAKVELLQHYKRQHRRQPTQKELQPKNKVKVSEGALPRRILPCPATASGNVNEVRLPAITEKVIPPPAGKPQTIKTFTQKPKIHIKEMHIKQAPQTVQLQPQPKQEAIKADYPNGLTCSKCHGVFYWRDNLTEHYKQHRLYDEAHPRADANVRQTNAGTDARCSQAMPHFMKLSNNNSNNNNNNLIQSVIVLRSNACESAMTQRPQPPAEAATTANPAYAGIGIPSDAIPQVVEMEDEVDFNFNGETIFDDFDVNVENDEDVIDATSVGDDISDLLLTSDDDEFATLLGEEEPPGDSLLSHVIRQPQQYCAQCNLKFASQYQYENHMFIHRGLAPYRCELCTNLYNRKRALIRHYRAVHKQLPTRDMIQARGDKSFQEAAPLSQSRLEAQTSSAYMCAKCPYEATTIFDMQMHLSHSHNTDDEKYILQKLPYECPRCIRSFASKTRLACHLECSHTPAAIVRINTIESQMLTNGTSSS